MSMRFLISPNTDEYMDRNSLCGLVRALRAAGHEVYFPSRALDGFETTPICRELGIDVLFQLNRARPYDLPKNIRHIAWFQDPPLVPADLGERVQPSDIIYRVLPRQNYEPNITGRCHEGLLFLAMDEVAINAFVPPAEATVDFSFCGTMVPPFNFPSSPPDFTPFVPRAAWKRMILATYVRYVSTPVAKTAVGRSLWKLLRAMSRGRLPSAEISAAYRLNEVLTNSVLRAMANVAELLNEPLVGNWDPEKLARKMCEIVAPQLPELSPQMAKELNSRAIEYALHVPRLIERYILVESILHVTDSVELYGVNWNLHPMFAPYHKGTVTGPQALFAIYAKSRLNGAYTARSFIHRRILECMAVGGFLFTNASIYDRSPGGLHHFFEPGTHYGDYTPNNVQEEACRWLRDDSRRKQVGTNAAAAVREKHLWRHRVKQLIGDLSDSNAKVRI